MKALILARVSTKEQAEEGQSIPAQTRRLFDYVKTKQLEHFKTFQIAESSTKDTRKEFQKILDIIKNSKEILALVVETVDRLQRSFKESVILDDLRKEGKVELHFVRENLVLTKNANSSQLLQWDMAVMFARSYVLQLSDNVKRSFEQAFKDGKFTSKAPLGYINTKDESGNPTIIPNPENSHLVAKMFEMYATGNYSLKNLVKELKKLGLKTNKGKQVSVSQAERILRNPFYYGVMEVKGVQSPHRYEPIISHSLFLKVQEAKGRYHKKPFQYAAKPFALRGLITCANCGCLYSPQSKKGHTYYNCTNYKGICKRVYIKEEDLLKSVCEELGFLQLPQEGIDYLVESLKTTNKAEYAFHSQSMSGLKSEYDKIEARLSKMLDDKFDGSITQETYDIKLKEYKSRQNEILQKMQEHSDADENYYITAAKILDISKRAVEIFKRSEPLEKRQFLNYLLQNSQIKDGQLVLDYKKPFDFIAHFAKQNREQKRKNTTKSDVHSIWLGGWDSDPRPID